MICSKCYLSSTRKRIVKGAGNLPCRYLIIGSGIDRAEESLGEPILGIKKKLLFEMLSRAGIKPEECYFTNLILCRSDGEIKDICKISCAANIMDIFGKSECKRVILIGKPAQEFYKDTFKNSIEIYDLEFMHRNGGVGGAYFMQMVRRLKEAQVEEKVTKASRDYECTGFNC